jgi:peptidoglycan/LPS O-acetylase OafA/YrhL
MGLAVLEPPILHSAYGSRKKLVLPNRFLKEGSSGRLRELDGWRAVSVFLVILCHISNRYSQSIPHIPIVSLFLGFCGPLGVKIFFVISGFVICRLLIAEEARTGNISLKAFYCRRIFRILPPLFVYLSVVCSLYFLGFIQEHWKSILYGGLFLRDLHLGTEGWFAGHTWSLAVEEQFYLTFPTAFLVTPQRWRPRIFLGVFLACALWSISLGFSGSFDQLATFVRPGFSCISFGVLMALYEDQARRWASAIPWFAVALISLSVALHPVAAGTWETAIFDGLFVPPAIGLLLLFSLVHGSWLRSFLCSKPLQAIGITSYGIYLWQELFTGTAQHYLAAGQLIPRFFPLIFVVIPLSYFFIEKPAMQYGKLLSKQMIENYPRRYLSLHLSR